MGRAARLVRADRAGDEAFEAAVALEAAAYPADEAASPDAMRARREAAGALFWLALDAEGGQVVGLVNGTLTSADSLTAESMHAHEPEGTTLCIHSVVTDQQLRRQGLARAVLRRYLDLVAETQPAIRRVLLISKENLVPFYESCGFSSLGKSNVEHGQDQWYELGLDLRRSSVACVNAFADPRARFSGNPAAVVVLPFTTRTLAQPEPQWIVDEMGLDARCEEWMKKVAAQMNLSETAFLRDLGSAEGGVHRFELRWLTPKSEVDLCGHATLASAGALWAGDVTKLDPTGAYAKATTFEFESRSGVLRASRRDGGITELDFPLIPFTEGDQAVLDTVVSALNIDPDQVEKALKVRSDYMVQVKTKAVVVGAAPNFAELAKVEARAVSVTALADDDDPFDFVTRLFGPKVGINEDPFTGSACCYLGPYWGGKLGKSTLKVFQASERGGMATIDVDTSAGRVRLQGVTEVSWRGETLTTPFMPTAI